MKKLLLLLALAPTLLIAQSKKQRKALAEQQKVGQAVINNLRAHVQYLADDKLEGRSTGSAGENMAMEYISNQFKLTGLQPKGTNGYVQQFNIPEGKQIDSTTFLSLDGARLVLNKDYIPLAFSAPKSLKGMPAMALREKGVPWFFDAKDLLDANAANASFNMNDAIRKEAARSASKGATGLFVYNSSNVAGNIRFDNKDTAQPSSIPVVYILPDGYKKYFADHSQVLDIELNVAFREKNRSGHNVIGYIDNGAPTAVVIGAHYDHLGLGEDANASDTGKIIHNGADDNASGTSLLIEVAKMLKSSKAKTNNYLFIAFSGEEIGSLGSKSWLENPTITLPINYMVNLDMVGRYDASKKLSVSGYGSSPLWPQAITALNDKTLQLKLDSTAGTLGDHLSFYRKNIPVLFLNTGTHNDFHRATDDADKINYDGLLNIARYLTRIIEFTDGRGKLAFAKSQ